MAFPTNQGFKNTHDFKPIFDALSSIYDIIQSGGIGDATSANQLLQLAQETDTANNTTSILAKLTADPSTGTKQDTGNTSLASILAKLIANPSTDTLQTTGNNSLASIDEKFTTFK